MPIIANHKENKIPMFIKFLQDNQGIAIFMGFGSVGTWLVSNINPYLQFGVLVLTMATLIVSLKKSYKNRKHKKYDMD